MCLPKVQSNSLEEEDGTVKLEYGLKFNLENVRAEIFLGAEGCLAWNS